ncbi:MAG TPA: M15 family metallopeptidase [Micromonosporaceae bacterium]|nr:M15 family metallopeptidase [Micromonosporaceae bacterium]
MGTARLAGYRVLAVLSATLGVAVGCGGATNGGVTRAAPSPSPSASTTMPASVVPTTAVPTTAVPTTAVPTTAAPATAGPAGTVPAATVPGAPTATTFVGTASPITAADVPHSWRAGCPVGPDQLRLLRLSYRGFDRQAHVGTLVVHESVAADVITVFGTLFREGFAIRQMVPVDAYGGSDSASMAADNTSGFNCRHAVAPGTPRWSAHAYGRAIDVNPVENPYLDRGSVLPPAGAAYLDRSRHRPGMATSGGVLVRAFAAVGWSWGGRWSAAPDYQHFSKGG